MRSRRSNERNVDRVWLEPRAGGFVVFASRDGEPLTVSPMAFEEAERIALEYAKRTGAVYNPDAVSR